jgi:hypothetical protein
MASERIRFRIGPIPSTSARSWLLSARQNLLRVIAASGEAVPFKLPDEVSDYFIAALDAWTVAAATDETFDFEDELDVDAVARIFVYWLNLVSLSRAQRDRLGLVDPPAESRDFVDAVRASMLCSLSRHEKLEHFGDFVRARQGPT